MPNPEPGIVSRSGFRQVRPRCASTEADGGLVFLRPAACGLAIFTIPQELEVRLQDLYLDIQDI